MSTLSDRLKSLGEESGFAKIGIAPAVSPTGFHRLLDWVSRGHNAEMQWVDRRLEAYRHPDGVMSGTRSVIMAAMNYHDGKPATDGPRIARYASGSADYHDVLKPLLKRLVELLRGEFPQSRNRIVIDTAPLLERDFGRLAGLGWFGKNTMLISRSIGSWFFLGAVLTDIELTYDQPLEQTFCGSCTKCLDACPTDAFPEPGVLDARRCISYLTIEHRHAGIPEELRSGLGPWLFGCDVCQDVCPWNRFAPGDTLPEFQQILGFSTSECRSLLRMTEEEFRDRFSGSPLLRSGRTGLLRNAAIVLANLGDLDSRPELEALLQDREEILRETAAWAIQQLEGRENVTSSHQKS